MRLLATRPRGRHNLQIVALTGDAVCGGAAADLLGLSGCVMRFAAGDLVCGRRWLCGSRRRGEACTTYAEATTAKVTVVTGRAARSGDVAVAGKSAGADAVLAWPDAVISPLSPEAAVHIEWKGAWPR